MNQNRFRAWDTINKEWISEYVIIDCDGHLFVTQPQKVKIKDLTKIETSHFTGFYDKNKKEIYFYDIIEDECPTDKPLFLLEPNLWSVFDELENGFPIVKVIGNKFENPELLTLHVL